MPDNKFEVSDGPARSAPSLRESVGDRLEPAALLRALRENIRLILIAAAAAVAVALFVTILSPMKFRARGSLYLG